MPLGNGPYSVMTVDLSVLLLKLHLRSIYTRRNVTTQLTLEMGYKKNQQQSMSWYIRSFFGFTFLNILYFFKYSCTDIFYRRSLYTFYSRSRRDVTRLSNKRSPYLFGVATANRTKVTTPNKYGAEIIARMSDWENGNACHGPHSDSGSEHSQFNSLRLVKREAVFPNPRRALIGWNQLWRINDSPYYCE